MRICELHGAAIGTCEEPAALEVGDSAEDVLATIMAQLRAAIAPAPDGSRQLVRVAVDRNGVPESRSEALH